MKRDARTTHQHVVFAGGGSGGHVFPGLAVAEILLERGWSVSWIGRPDGMERALVEAREVMYDGVTARPLVGQGMVARVGALLTLGRSSLRAVRTLGRRSARVVVGTGGYVCAPAVLAARSRRRPVVLLEPNARAGTANRWLSRWASVAAVAASETGSDLRCPARVTGVPVRAGFGRVRVAEPAGTPRLLVLGGSQGARDLNERIPQAIGALSGLDIAVTHQTGAGAEGAVREAWSRVGRPGLSVEVTPFVEDMVAALDASDLVVSRAGAVTLAEICAAGRASLLIPLEIAAGHQVANARRLVDAGAAGLFRGDSTRELADRLHDLLSDSAALVAMSEAARSLGAPDAAARIADLVEEVAA